MQSSPLLMCVAKSSSGCPGLPDPSEEGMPTDRLLLGLCHHPHYVGFPGCFLSFGVSDEWKGFLRRFWLGLGCCILTFLSNVAIVLLIAIF